MRSPFGASVSEAGIDLWLIPCSAEIAGPVFQKLPDYLAETGYATPTDSMAGPFQYGHDTNLSVWEWRKERPRLDEAGNNHMAGYHSGRPSWMDEGFYPINERLIRGMRRGQDEVAIVDVGGNMGHDLQELKGKQPALPGRFVLQDLPHVIKQIHDPLEGIEPMCHDFFTEQPIKGTQMPPRVRPALWKLMCIRISSILHAFHTP